MSEPVVPLLAPNPQLESAEKRPPERVNEREPTQPFVSDPMSGSTTSPNFHSMSGHLSQSLTPNRSSAPNTPQSQPSMHHSVSSPMTPQQIYSPVGPQSQQSSPLSHTPQQSPHQPSTPLAPQQSPQQFIHVPSPQSQQPSSPAMNSKISRLHSSMTHMATPVESVAPQLPPVVPPIHVPQNTHTSSHRSPRSKSSSSISKLQQLTNGINQSLPQPPVHQSMHLNLIYIFE